MTKTSSKKKDITPITSWQEWFEHAARHYDNPSMKMAYYTDAHSGIPVTEDIMAATYKDIWNKLSPNKKDKILDVGCGVGNLFKHYGHQAALIIGTDISLTMVHDALKRNPQGKFLTCESLCLPFKPKTFDRVLCYSVFQYLSSLPTALRVMDELARLCKNDAVIMLGDIIHPPSSPKAKIPQIKPSEKKWWPDHLNHNLKKMRFDPSFFMEYGQKRKYNIKVLKQNIPSRKLPDVRYDVLIQLPPT